MTKDLLLNAVCKLFKDHPAPVSLWSSLPQSPFFDSNGSCDQVAEKLRETSKNLNTTLSRSFIILLRKIYAPLERTLLLSSFYFWHFAIISDFKQKILRKKYKTIHR
jgi:hypothetical protein